MENGFSILMFIFSGMLLLYAGLLALTKDYKLLPVRARVSVKPKNPKLYASRFARVIALVAVAPLLGGVVGLFSLLGAAFALIGSAALFIFLGTKIMKGVE